MKKRYALICLCLAALLLLASCAPAPTEGTKTFTLEVYLEDGTLSLSREFTTDALYVGDVLAAEGLVEGDAGPFGLYIKRVNGVFAEYETTGNYWAFYENGTLAARGVDTTPIEDGATYAFKVEK